MLGWLCFIYSSLTASFICPPAADHSFVLLMSKFPSDFLTYPNSDLSLPGKSSDLTGLKITPSKVAWQSLVLLHCLNSIPNYLISSSWSTNVKNHFIVTSGCVVVGQKLLVQGAEFMVMGFLGCGCDYLVLSLTQIEEQTNNWLVIPDRGVCMHLIS